MAANWVRTRGLTTFLNEVDRVFPGRDKASDGSVGNLAHQVSPSGHNPDRTGRAEYKDGDAKNEVRAVDIDRDLRPGSGVDWMELLVQYVIRLARAGVYVPFEYIIFKGRIWGKWDGWVTRTYTGANSHHLHAHFSGGYSEKADEWTGSLGLHTLLDRPGGHVALTTAELNDIATANAAKLHVDLETPTSGLYRSFAARSGAGVLDQLWLGYHAATNSATYQAATEDQKRSMRNVRDLMRAIVGGPTDLTGVVAQLGELMNRDEVDESEVAAQLAPLVLAPLSEALTAAVVTALEDNNGVLLTVDQVQEAVKTGITEVLKEGVGE